jgi:hypothetical protein
MTIEWACPEYPKDRLKRTGPTKVPKDSGRVRTRERANEEEDQRRKEPPLRGGERGVRAPEAP